MPVNVYHSDVSTSEIHIPYNWTYADAAARTSATGFVSSDVGKLARQLDNNTLWMLTATTPTWVQVGGSGGSLEVMEADGTPDVTGVTTITVSNGTLTDNGGGSITITTGGGGGNITYNNAWASAPSSPASGDLWLPTDAGFIGRYTGSVWAWRYKGIPATPPDVANYTWVNQRSATATSAHGGIYITTPVDSTHKEMLAKARPSSPPWSVVAAVEVSLATAANSAFALGFRESSTGKLVDVALFNSGSILQLIVTHWSDGNTFVGTDVTTANVDPVSHGPLFLKIKDDNTNLVFSWSIDGYNFIQFGTVGRTAYMAGGADQYYIAIRSDGGTTAAFVSSLVEGT